MKESIKKNRASGTPKRGRPTISADQKRKMREKIAQVTQRLFQAEGYHQISMRRIAKEIGCSPMSLYKYYNAKIDILHTLWAEIFASVFSRINELDSVNMTATQALTQICRTYVDYWLQHTEHYRLVFMSEGVNQPEVSTFLAEPGLIERYQVFAIAVNAASSNELNDDEIKLQADTLMCFLHGIAHNKITISGYDWPSTDRLISTAVRCVIDA